MMQFLNCVKKISRNDLDFYYGRGKNDARISNCKIVVRFKPMKRKFYSIMCPISFLDPIHRKQQFLAAEDSHFFWNTAPSNVRVMQMIAISGGQGLGFLIRRIIYDKSSWAPSHHASNCSIHFSSEQFYKIAFSGFLLK